MKNAVPRSLVELAMTQSISILERDSTESYDLLHERVKEIRSKDEIFFILMIYRKGREGNEGKVRQGRRRERRE